MEHIRWGICRHCGSYEIEAECSVCGHAPHPVRVVPEMPGALHDALLSAAQAAAPSIGIWLQHRGVLIHVAQRTGTFIAQAEDPYSRVSFRCETGEQGRNWSLRVAGRLESAFQDFLAYAAATYAGTERPLLPGVVLGEGHLDALRRAWFARQHEQPVASEELSLLSDSEIACAYALGLTQYDSRTQLPPHSCPQKHRLPALPDVARRLLRGLLSARRELRFAQLGEAP